MTRFFDSYFSVFQRVTHFDEIFLAHFSTRSAPDRAKTTRSGEVPPLAVVPFGPAGFTLGFAAGLFGLTLGLLGGLLVLGHFLLALDGNYADLGILAEYRIIEGGVFSAVPYAYELFDLGIPA